MTDMKTTMILSTLCALALLTGCGGEGGFLVQPVPADQHMREAVIGGSESLFVTGKIAIIDVDGMIMNMKPSSLLGMGSQENPVAVFQEKLNAAAEDSHVKAVVLRINSPGGTVSASEAMYDALIRFRTESKKPVITFIQDVGASGAYYLACGTPRILCQSTSVTGSIGVLIQTFSLAGTLKKIGVTTTAITSGPMKDMGSPLKELSEEDRQFLQKIVSEYYDKFVSVVAAGRKNLKEEQVRTLADGRIYTGKQALEAGLVDRLGELNDAVNEAKKAAGLT